jgi:dipeptidyl aminopeptidase/acylaminoacyl peptidase
MRHHVRLRHLAASAIALTALTAVAETPAVRIGSWEVLGPLQMTLPVFDELEDDGPAEGILESASLPDLRGLPATGRALDGFRTPVSWRVVESGADGVVTFGKPAVVDDRETALAWLATSVRATRFVKAKLDVDCDHPWKAVFDGKPVDPEDLDIEVEPGDHVLFVVTAFDPETGKPWTVSVAINPESPGSVTADLHREHELAILDILDAATATAFDLSPKGDRVVLTLSRVRPGGNETETWVELRSTADGTLLRSWHGVPKMAEVRFAPTGNRLSYVSQDAKKRATLWLADLDNGTAREVVEGVEDWAGYLWSPTGTAIVFSTTTKPEKNTSGITRLQGLLDRMADHRNLDDLHLVNVSSGLQRQLTGGKLSCSAAAFSPDGSRLLVTREVEDLSRRPYSRNELWEIELATGAARKVRDFWWFGGVEYAPDGRRLLVRAGPSEFGDAGIAVDSPSPVNDFDGQLFIWDPETDGVEAITRQFDPAVSEARWSRFDGAIIALALDGDLQSLFRYDPVEKAFSPIRTDVESVASFAVAREGPTIVAEGSSVWQPQRVVAIEEGDQSARLLLEPAAEEFADVRRGDVQEWNFTSTDGREIVGRIYYPTTFDPEKRYPAIVNYYGGTSPMDRSFGGRYPAEWWAANGYVVYVLTPTGAYGWGQEASSVHVNDWGEVTSRQIVEASTAFIETHPFVDPGRVGCIGASYGGFMTMTLVTETDLFAAAVAHAGISALSSYWGEGYWGYSYGAVANADSFPWNRRDIFVDRSPLFNADKVTTPVLLTHGDADPNVPLGESDQFYAALKLLGVEVEYLRIAGLGHLIMEHDKRALWSKSILAWFDRRLKDQPEWWDALYPEE